MMRSLSLGNLLFEVPSVNIPGGLRIVQRSDFRERNTEHRITLHQRNDVSDL
jgi:hypothetical protein